MKYKILILEWFKNYNKNIKIIETQDALYLIMEYA